MHAIELFEKTISAQELGRRKKFRFCEAKLVSDYLGQPSRHPVFLKWQNKPSALSFCRTSQSHGIALQHRGLCRIPDNPASRYASIQFGQTTRRQAAFYFGRLESCKENLGTGKRLRRPSRTFIAWSLRTMRLRGIHLPVLSRQARGRTTDYFEAKIGLLHNG